jgi:hypothetical protein
MSYHLQKGSENKIAIVFSCPGRYELEANIPAAKATGANLCILLEKLSVAINSNDLIRYKITITNAWDKVEYKKLTNKSEASDTDICSVNNLDRLQSEIDHIEDFIVCCGEKAKLAVQNCNFSSDKKLIFIGHLSTRGLNKIKKDIDDNIIMSAKAMKSYNDIRPLNKLQNENTSKRLDVVCKMIIDQLAKRNINEK